MPRILMPVRLQIISHACDKKPSAVANPNPNLGCRWSTANVTPLERAVKSAFHLVLLFLADWFSVPLLANGWAHDPVGVTQIVFGIGQAELFGPDSDDARFLITELRFKESWLTLHPYVILTYGENDVVYAGSWLSRTFALSENWWLRASAGPGYYSRRRSSKGLGHSLEFYSCIELSRRAGRRGRLGMVFGHISNGGLGDRNPGSEIVTLNYAHAWR